MRLVHLAWYVCGVSVLGALLASAITVAPGGGRESFVTVVMSVWGCVAVVSAVAAVVAGRLPPTQAVHQSRPLWTAAVAIAITATLLLALVG